jgi:hypothetical protein
MKKSIITGTFFLTSLFIPTTAFAAGIGTFCNTSGSGFSRLCLSNAGNIGPILGSVINLLFLVAGIIALFYLIIGGIKWVTSGGDSKNIEAARNQIIAAAVGLGVTFLSYLIINLLLQFFLGADLNHLQFPTLQLNG